MKRLSIGVIYLITYPNGKIYIGQDRTNDINYFGSACSFMIAKDFDAKARRDFTVRKQILATYRNITICDLNARERAFITKYRSNDPSIGYNRTGVARRICRELLLNEGG
jgi:hypothetical protein